MGREHGRLRLRGDPPRGRPGQGRRRVQRPVRPVRYGRHRRQGMAVRDRREPEDLLQRHSQQGSGQHGHDLPCPFRDAEQRQGVERHGQYAGVRPVRRQLRGVRLLHEHPDGGHSDGRELFRRGQVRLFHLMQRRLELHFPPHTFQLPLGGVRLQQHARFRDRKLRHRALRHALLRP